MQASRRRQRRGRVDELDPASDLGAGGRVRGLPALQRRVSQQPAEHVVQFGQHLGRGDPAHFGVAHRGADRLGGRIGEHQPVEHGVGVEHDVGCGVHGWAQRDAAKGAGSVEQGRPLICSASRRALPQASVQPWAPWPRLNQTPGVALGPITGGP